jgi:hypothetical protein
MNLTQKKNKKKLIINNSIIYSYKNDQKVYIDKKIRSNQNFSDDIFSKRTIFIDILILFTNIIDNCSRTESLWGVDEISSLFSNLF